MLWPTIMGAYTRTCAYVVMSPHDGRRRLHAMEPRAHLGCMHGPHILYAQLAIAYVRIQTRVGLPTKNRQDERQSMKQFF